MFKKIFIGCLVLALVFTGYLFLQANHSADQTTTHSMAQELKPCPDKPNCVSTKATDDDHKAEPIPYTGSQAAAQTKLLGILDGTKRTERQTVEGDYIHYTFKTWPIPFIDDVEFIFDDDAKLIHYRSASRVGHSDLGVNAKRMQKIVKAFQKE